MSAQHIILCVGRRAVDPLIGALDGYIARLSCLCPIRMVRVRPSTPAGEAAALLALLPAAAYATVLEVGGTAHTTDSLVALLRQLQATGRRQLAWIIGGADGLDGAVRQRAQATWCLTPLTLPHRLAHVVVAEQLYRAQTVLANRPYHHGGRGAV